MPDYKISPQDKFEAESRSQSNEVIIFLELSSGNIAVFNNARKLTGIIDINDAASFGEMVATEDIKRAYQHIRNKLWKKPVSNLQHITTEIVEDDITPMQPLDLDQFVKPQPK
jgi:hypothetical protein